MKLRRSSGRMMQMNPLEDSLIVLEPGSVKLEEPGVGTRAHPSEGDPANDWLCVSCSNRVASEKDRYLHEGRSEFVLPQLKTPVWGWSLRTDAR
jgi:hypothetical protein